MRLQYLLILFVLAFTTTDVSAQTNSIEKFKEFVLLKINGNQDDKEAFWHFWNRCNLKTNDQVFRLLNTYIFDSEAPFFEVVRNDPEIDLAGMAPRNGRLHRIDIAHIEQFPQTNLDFKNNLIFPGNLPIWGFTLCGSLAHEVSEAFFDFNNKRNESTSERYNRAHRHAISVQNKVRRAMGQSQCRYKDWIGLEFTMGHDGHNDTLIPLGRNIQRIHQTGQKTGQKLIFTYEEGTGSETRDEGCTEDQYKPEN